MNTEFVTKVSVALMPGMCHGDYVHVAVLEVEKGTVPTMISERALGVLAIVWRRERCHVGTTEKCASERAIAEAEERAEELNGMTARARHEYRMDESRVAKIWAISATGWPSPKAAGWLKTARITTETPRSELGWIRLAEANV